MHFCHGCVSSISILASLSDLHSPSSGLLIAFMCLISFMNFSSCLNMSIASSSSWSAVDVATSNRLSLSRLASSSFADLK